MLNRALFCSLLKFSLLQFVSSNGFFGQTLLHDAGALLMGQNSYAYFLPSYFAGNLTETRK